MIIDRISKRLKTDRARALALEVFAIFLGITASLALEEWRDERQQAEQFERFLQGIYFDAAREQGHTLTSMMAVNSRVVALVELTSSDLSRMPEERLLALTEVAFSPWWGNTANNPSYRSLLNSQLSVPFDETMQRLHAAFNQYETLQVIIDTHQRFFDDFGTAMLHRLEMVSNREVWQSIDGISAPAPRLDALEYQGIRDQVIGAGVTPGPATARRIRALVEDPEVKRELVHGIERVIQLGDFVRGLTGTLEVIRSIVRERMPEVRLPVTQVTLLGTATEGEWFLDRGLKLERSAGDADQWSLEATLSAGVVKFLGSEADWSMSWGAMPDWSAIDPLSDFTGYLGDPGRVFPEGVAVYDGQNIPVTAGRYLIRFNSRTYRYAFERLSD